MADASLRRTRRAESAVPIQVRARFGNASARPRVVQVYSPQRGWRSDHAREVLTAELVKQLRAHGITRVEARWRRRLERISLFTLGLG